MYSANCDFHIAGESSSCSPVTEFSSDCGAGIDLLIVEDYSDLANMLQMVLEDRGYSVTLAPSVADAIRQMELRSFDLMLSDLTLPDGTGLQLMERVRGRLRAIALSGCGSVDSTGLLHEAGFSDHLVKPFGEQDLLAAIRRALR